MVHISTFRDTSMHRLHGKAHNPQFIYQCQYNQKQRPPLFDHDHTMMSTLSTSTIVALLLAMPTAHASVIQEQEPNDSIASSQVSIQIISSILEL